MKLLAMLLMTCGFCLAQNPPNVPAKTLPPAGVDRSMEKPATPVPGVGIPNGVPAAKLGGQEVFVYDPTGKRDPFQPDSPKADKPEETAPHPVEELAQVTPTRTLEPLETFDLTQLRVGAIIWNTKNPRAMVVDPTGGTHYLKLKTRIGKRNGFVAAIREGEVVVVEYVQENGQYTKTFRVLELR